jgi:HK97 family phage prohead protease
MGTQTATTQSNDIQVRSFRAAASDDDKKIRGYAALFNVETELYPGVREKIAPGAFRNALAKSDIRLLLNHDPNHVLGRNKAKTLTVFEDEKGLPFEANLPDSRGDVLESIKRGDIDQCSFGFKIKSQQWDDLEDGSVMRTITEVAELFDVSVVTYAQYPETVVSHDAKEVYEKRMKSKDSPTPPQPEEKRSTKDYARIGQLHGHKIKILNQI